MNRLSWDTTAPRRPKRSSSPLRRQEEALLAADAELVRDAWRMIRPRPF